MTPIEKALKDNQADMQIDFGHRWLFWSALNEWVVKERINIESPGDSWVLYQGNSIVKALKYLIKGAK